MEVARVNGMCWVSELQRPLYIAMYPKSTANLREDKRHLRGQGLWCFVEENLPCFIQGEALLNPVDKVAGN
jgi:hypothetical protein